MLRVSVLTRQTDGVKNGWKNFHSERSIGAANDPAESAERLSIPEILRIVFVDGHEPGREGGYGEEWLEMIPTGHGHREKQNLLLVLDHAWLEPPP
jgi:hypothetical protein